MVLVKRLYTSGTVNMPDIRSVQTQLQPNMVEAASGVRDPDEWKWQRLGGSDQDLLNIRRDQAQEAAQKLWISSPMAHRIVETVVDFVVGGGTNPAMPGLTLGSKDAEAHHVLDEFWNSPHNAFPDNLYEHVQELFVFGELLYLINVRDRFVATTFVPALQIKKVIQADGLPGVPKHIVLKNDDVYDVIHWNEQAEQFEGNCFYKRINRLGGQLRGYSFMLPMIDWLSVWESYIYNKLERHAHFDAIWWEVTREGETQQQIEEWLKSARSRPPRPGTVIAHNERVRWDLVQPSRAMAERTDIPEYFRDFLLATGGLGPWNPDRPLTRGQGEILDPTARSLSIRQMQTAGFYRQIGQFVLQEAGIDATPVVHMPRLGVRDIQRSSGAVSRFAQALETAMANGWVSQEQAGQVFWDILVSLGFGI